MIVCRLTPRRSSISPSRLYSEQGIEFDAAEVAQQVRDFFHGRLVSMARDEKIPADTVAAVSAVHIIALSVFFARCAALDEARKNDAETFDNLATAYARAAHISKPELGAEIRPRPDGRG